MSGPKHLWSGDWENESEDASEQLTRRPRRRDPEPVAPAPPPEPPRTRRGVRPWVLPLAVGVIVIAAAAYGLTRLVHPSSTRVDHNIPASISPLPPPHVTGSPRPIRWLGMEIITAPQGVPVVETVRPNSNGDRAGLEPGDALLLVNNHPVGSSGSIATALQGLHSGDRVTMEVNNGGAIFQVVATLAAPPTPYP
ncbi:MAG: PDZ domain-containing protein [Solirubrobacteraceae bacterium]